MTRQLDDLPKHTIARAEGLLYFIYIVHLHQFEGIRHSKHLQDVPYRRSVRTMPHVRIS